MRLSHLGDVIHALPVWNAVARAFPDAEMAFATQPAYAKLLFGMPRLERIVSFERHNGIAAWWRFRRQARAFRPTWTIDCQGNWKGALATWVSGAPRRSGLAPVDWREKSARRLCNDLASDDDRAEGQDHAVDRQLALARHVTGKAAAADFDLGLTPSERERGRAALFARLPTTGAGAPVLLHLARPGDARSWPALSFFELAQQAAEAGHPVLVLGGPDEAPLARGAPKLHGVHTEINTFDLRALAGLFAAAAEAGATLVACDSGPAHLAAAVGLAVHLLHGPQDPQRTGPWPPPGRTDFLSPHHTQTAALELDCRPCVSRLCTNPSGPRCLEELSSAEVAAAVLGKT